jgi:hypothetical protein
VFLVGAHGFLRQQTAGQMNVVTAWVVVGAVACVARRREGAAGALAGIGFAWKLAPALLIVALGGMRRRRGCAAGIVVAGALWAASLAIAGWGVQMDALRMVGEMGYGSSTWAEFGREYYRDPFNQSANALFHHLLAAGGGTTPWLDAGAPAANGATVVFALGVVVLWVWRRGKLLAGGDEGKKGTGSNLGKTGTSSNQGKTGTGSDCIPNSCLSPLSPSPLSSSLSPLSPLSLSPLSQGEARLLLAASVAMLLLPSLMWDHYAVQLLPALMWLAGDRRIGTSWPRAVGLVAVMAALMWPVNFAAEGNRAGAGLLMMSLRLWPTLGLYGWLLGEMAITGGVQLKRSGDFPKFPRLSRKKK